MTIWRLVQKLQRFWWSNFCHFQNKDKKEFRVLIKHCFLMGKNTVESKQWFGKCYSDSETGKLTFIDWYSEFKRGRTNSDDAERTGHPKSAVDPENITKVHKIVSANRKLKLPEIADTLKIYYLKVLIILHESLGMRKFFSKWVPRLLTPDQKQQHVEDSKRCMKLFKPGKCGFSASVCDNGWRAWYFINRLSWER